MDEEINLTIPEPDEDIEDEGGLVQVGERDREEQEKINKKYAYLCRPPLDPNFDEKSVLEIMSVDVDYYLYRCKQPSLE